MKPCHENNGAEVYVGWAATVHNPLICFNVHTTVESRLTRTFLLVSCSITFKIYPGLCTVESSRPKNANKKYSKDVCQTS